MKIFRGLNLEVCFCKNCLCSIELIGYVDLSDFHETWPECLTGINAPKCVRLLRNSKYFSRGAPECDADRTIFYCPTSKWIYSGTNRNIEKASHTLLAYLLLSCIDQFVLMFALTWRLVIQ